MTDPTLAQIKYARTLKIEGAEEMSKEELSKAIDEKVGAGKPKQFQSARHDEVITRTLKPHSYEFGRANNRHKVYYETVEELKLYIAALESAGLVEPTDLSVETIKM